MHTLFFLALVLISLLISAEVAFEQAGFTDLDWVISSSGDNLGKVSLSAGDWFDDSDEDAQIGLQTTEDASFYRISKTFDGFDGSDETVVIQFSVKNEQELKCGGFYLKVMPPGFDQDDFGGDTDYNIMIGGDKCGHGTNKIHFIINDNGVNHDWSKTIAPPSDQLTHLYTFVIHPDLTYELWIDLEEKSSGNIKDEWPILGEQEIDDSNDSKPADWVENAMIPDHEASQPEDWPEDEPEFIADDSAEVPEFWDEEEDGEWQPPMMPNPAYRGEWNAPMIPNPDYEGPWSPRKIPNPDYVDRDDIAKFSYGGVGIEIWQVESGSIFNNFYISHGDSATSEARTWAEDHWKAFVDGESAAFESFNAAEDIDEDDSIDEHDV